MSAPLAAVLAEWSSGVIWSRLPPDLQARVRLWVLDALGLMLAGSAVPAGRVVLEVAARPGGLPEATLLGVPLRVPAAWAALAHGTLAHALDFDDTFPASVVHPGSVVVATALAVGEARGADGAAVGAAIAAGYEMAARLGAAAGRAFHARGFQATSVVGPVVAAAVAGTLMRCAPRTTAEGMGLAGSMGGGLLAFLADGSWSKRLHPGWAAHGGIVAAELAAAGFPGPVSVLEGRHGLYAAFLGEGVAHLEGVTDRLGAVWLAGDAHAKLYPCAHAIHPFLDAAGALRDSHRLVAGDVEAVECEVAPWQLPIVGEPREEKVAPRTEYQARASLPFALAALFADGRVDLDTFTPEALARPDLRAFAARVRLEARAASHAEGHDARGFGAVLTVATRGGARLTGEVTEAGAPSPDAVRAKFRVTAGRRLPASRVAALEAAVDGLPATAPGTLAARCQP